MDIFRKSTFELFVQHGCERREQGVGDDLRALDGGMDAVALNRVRNVDQVFIDHGHKCGVVPGGKIAEDFLEGCDVVAAVVGGQGDAGKKNLDVRIFKCCEHLFEVASSLIRGKAAEAVVASEFDDNDFRMELEDVVQIGNGVLGGGAAGALIVDLVMVTTIVQIPLKRVGVRLSGLKAVTGGDAVAEADENGPVGGAQGSGNKKQAD